MKKVVAGHLVAVHYTGTLTNGEIFDMDNLFRGGDLVTNVTGVLDYNFSLWKIRYLVRYRLS